MDNKGDRRRKTFSLSDEEIRARLTAEQYRVTREQGTEPPFSNAYWNNQEKGFYLDVLSGELLFTSDDKFESSCGWPSCAGIQGRAERKAGLFMEWSGPRWCRVRRSYLGHVRRRAGSAEVLH